MLDPEEDPQKFISILLESLFILRKIPDAAEVWLNKQNIYKYLKCQSLFCLTVSQWLVCYTDFFNRHLQAKRKWVRDTVKHVNAGLDTFFFKFNIQVPFFNQWHAKLNKEIFNFSKKYRRRVLNRNTSTCKQILNPQWQFSGVSSIVMWDDSHYTCQCFYRPSSLECIQSWLP